MATNYKKNQERGIAILIIAILLFTVIYTWFNKVSADSKSLVNSTVSFYNLQSGATMSGIQKVTVLATYNKKRPKSLISSLSLSNDNQLIGTLYGNKGSFAFNWDTTQTTDGQHTLKADAITVGGKQSSSQISVTVSNQPQSNNTPGVDLILKDDNGQRIGETVYSNNFIGQEVKVFASAGVTKNNYAYIKNQTNIAQTVILKAKPWSRTWLVNYYDNTSAISRNILSPSGYSFQLNPQEERELRVEAKSTQGLPVGQFENVDLTATAGSLTDNARFIFTIK